MPMSVEMTLKHCNKPFKGETFPLLVNIHVRVEEERRVSREL